ncbi:MAG TPA: potassium channel family protein [Gillisia sp.]|nr:potassium channel family protein [Gillisia sp.]
MRFLLNSKIYGALFLVLVVFLSGVFWFKYFSDYTWVDAIYMTVITVSTVGYGEVKPLGPAEKIFTSALILSSVFILGYAFSVITEHVFSKNNIGNLREKKAQKKVKLMKNHIVVCGYGRNGKQAVQKLLAYKEPFVIIELNE